MVSALVQVVYVLKFFWWEMGYMGTMDIQHDRAGFYICWGCLVWVPSLYTCHTLYLVHNPYNLGMVWTATLLLVGLGGVYINYEADRQKQEFRQSKGNCRIWGKKAKGLKAEYVTVDGKKQTSLLLLSGWWGVSRHFHYLPEWMAGIRKAGIPASLCCRHRTSFLSICICYLICFAHDSHALVILSFRCDETMSVRGGMKMLTM